MAGKVAAGMNEDEMLSTYRSNLQLAIPLLEKHNIVGLIEPISTFPDYFLKDFDTGKTHDVLSKDVSTALRQPGLSNTQNTTSPRHFPSWSYSSRILENLSPANGFYISFDLKNY